MMTPPPTSKSPTQLTPRFEAALVYAHQLHAAQRRKGSSIPYISHLLSVAALVLEDGGSEDEAIAALLHDAIEDQGGATTRAEILQRFGPTVTAIVDGCTESDIIPKPPWKERKQAYLTDMRQAPASVLRVAIADKLHNVRSTLADLQREGETVWERFNADKADILAYYQAFLELIDHRIHQDGSSLTSGILVQELRRALAELQRRAQS